MWLAVRGRGERPSSAQVYELYRGKATDRCCGYTTLSIISFMLSVTIGCGYDRGLYRLSNY